MPNGTTGRRRKVPPCPCGCGQAPADTTRLRKIQCEECGYTARLSREWMAQGLPVCPCGTPLLPFCLIDRLSVPALEADAWSELEGRRIDHAQRSEYAQRAARRRRRCKLDGCSKWTAAGRLYCAQHAAEEMPF